MLKVLYADREGVPATDRGLAYGDGLFETIRMCGPKAVLRRYHLNRMVSDAERIGIKVGYAELDQELTRATSRLMPAGRTDAWILKMILTRGSGGRGYRPPGSAQQHLVFAAAAMPPMPEPTGVVVRRSRFPLTVNPRLAGIKTLNRLEQVMASSEFTGEEWELIMSDTTGDLVEGTRTNLLARVGDEWLTPPVSSIAVAGVMRQYVLECLQKVGERVVEQTLPTAIDSLPGFRGLYLLNSVFGIVAVRSFDAHDLPVDDALATICDPIETLE
ncbi:aminodeoxychorismate lyase [Marinobacter sp.]|uniref:aminodeoxychorismate lyase n=1 Tax=Marinobacter sp. TaxID=50741 RepID=UPI002B47C14F|nr:aminodeoxychorismate lyase [Marinobacter sp.]HKK55536.1 aminodeoxychorismate lyase [Marinobacter sp.]